MQLFYFAFCLNILWISILNSKGCLGSIHMLDICYWERIAGRRRFVGRYVEYWPFPESRPEDSVRVSQGARRASKGRKPKAVTSCGVLSQTHLAPCQQNDAHLKFTVQLQRKLFCIQSDSSKTNFKYIFLSFFFNSEYWCGGEKKLYLVIQRRGFKS